MKADEIEQKLIAERERLLDQIRRIEADFSEPLDDDLDDQAVEREDDDSLEGTERVASERLHSIDAALARLHTGQYGICTSCGDSIGHARLEAIPEAASCIVCATASSTKTPR